MEQKAEENLSVIRCRAGGFSLCRGGGRTQRVLNSPKKSNPPSGAGSEVLVGGEAWCSEGGWGSSTIAMSFTMIYSGHSCHQGFLDTHFLPWENLESFPLTFSLHVLALLWFMSLPNTGIGWPCGELYSILPLSLLLSVLRYLFYCYSERTWEERNSMPPFSPHTFLSALCSSLPWEHSAVTQI